MLRCYVNKMKVLLKSNQLFVSLTDSHRGKPISHQRLSHSVVKAIVIVGYNSMGLSPPEGFRAHNTWGFSTSLALLFKGVSIQDISAAVSWASPHTFVRFYRLDVTEPLLAHSVLSKKQQQKNNTRTDVFVFHMSPLYYVNSGGLGFLWYIITHHWVGWYACFEKHICNTGVVYIP